MKKIIPFVLLLFVLASCNNPVSITLDSKSPDGKTRIEIKGEKENPLLPFTVNMNVKSGDIPEGGLQFQIGATTLDASNVKFDWTDDRHCTISFTQGDGDVRAFDLSISDTNVLLQEIRKP